MDNIGRGQDILGRRGQGTESPEYHKDHCMDTEITKNYDRNSIRGSNSEPGAKIFKK